MFSLIITVISIALVVALTGATMYYGGSALVQGAINSDAHGFVSGAQQIASALILYEGDGHGGPLSLVTLVEGLGTDGIQHNSYSTNFIGVLIALEYLAQIPTVKSTPYNLQGDSVGHPWILHSAFDNSGDYPTKRMAIRADVASEVVCAKLNKPKEKALANGAALYKGSYECDWSNVYNRGAFSFFIQTNGYDYSKLN